MDKFIKYLQAKEVDITKKFESIVKFIEFHNLFHWIAFNTNIDDYAILFTQIRSLYNKKKQHNLLLANEWQRIKEKLNNQNIKAYLIKGLSFSNQFFNDITYRITRDIDIFISYNDFNNVHNILNEAGYTLIFPKCLSKITQQKQKYLKEIIYLNTSKKISIEVHFRLMIPEFLFNDIENIFKTSNHSSLFNTYQPEWTMHYLIAHCAIHNWALLGYLADVALLIKKNTIDWQKFKEYACHHNNLRMIKITLNLSNYFFNINIPDEYKCLSKIEKILIAIVLNYYDKIKKNRSGISGIKKYFVKLNLQSSLKYKYHYLKTRFYRKFFIQM
ncbi:MAG: nucleotidyltransferase family protein [Bacteroidales bacterium]|nr:nucleotidyltransferase family protein [Bacteroidales bacterium]